MASNGALNARDRGAMLSRLASERFDVLVIGGGVTGAGTALDAASRGLRVALVEKQPFDAQLDAGYDGRASAIAYACFRQWKALGVGDGLEPQACRMDEIFVTDGRLPGAARASRPPATTPWPRSRTSSGSSSAFGKQRAARRWSRRRAACRSF